MPALVALVLLAAATLTAALPRGQQPAPSLAEKVSITVDAGDRVAPMRPMWAWFGYDEPNYTYMPDGRKLLSALAALSPVPVYVRAHNLLTTGDGTPALKWGSTNAYTEDADGRPSYDWTIVDRIIDTYVERGMKPLVEIGFMPEALSSRPQPYKHDWAPGVNYSRIYTGWTYPPTDYDKWRELVFQWVRHSVERYGRPEVESWYWEVWNEPDIGYWSGTPEEFQQALRLRRRRREARPAHRACRRPARDRAARRPDAGPAARLPRALPARHQLRDRTRSDRPLDFVAFHAKGAPAGR